jgi:hypothetical protein
MSAVATSFVIAACTTSPAFNRYPQTACAQYVHAKKEFKADVNWCVRYVEVRGDAMEVRVSWELLKLRGSHDSVFQITDEYNPRMYLTDEFGQRYDHTRVSGAALGSRYQLGSTQSGSFFFPLPRAGARTFLFHDDENGVRLQLRL